MSNADKLTDFAIGKLNAVFDGVSHTLPTVTKYALEVTSMDCLKVIFLGFFWLLLSGVVSVWTIWFFKKMKAANNEAQTYDKGLPYVAWALFGVIPLMIPVGVSLAYLLDFWAWVGIFHPDLYLVHMAMVKVTG